MGKDWEVSYSDEPDTKSSEFGERCRCVETGHVLETRQLFAYTMELSLTP